MGTASYPSNINPNGLLLALHIPVFHGTFTACARDPGDGKRCHPLSLCSLCRCSPPRTSSVLPHHPLHLLRVLFSLPICGCLLLLHYFLSSCRLPWDEREVPRMFPVGSIPMKDVSMKRSHVCDSDCFKCRFSMSFVCVCVCC